MALLRQFCSRGRVKLWITLVIISGVFLQIVNFNISCPSGSCRFRRKRAIFPAANDPDVGMLEMLNTSRIGYGGEAAHIDVNKLPFEEAVKFNRSHIHRNYSSYISSLIPLRRHLKDVRMEDCRRNYSDQYLPKASVVIIFHNEHWSTLLRTVHSVLDNSPPHLVQEVLLVDDGSTEMTLKEPLAQYIAETFEKVKIQRFVTSQGLMRARNYGMSSAPVVLFLDAHCECFLGWLEPLVARIAKDERNVVMPTVHYIHPRTFEIGYNDQSVPILLFPDLLFDWMATSGRDHERTQKTDPIRAPAMIGCVFAVSRVWFRKLGLFDPGLAWWGGENTELSLKTWLCGGRLERVPCSNVAHMFFSHNFTAERQSTVYRNNMRVAAVWMGEYAVFVRGYNKTQVENMDLDSRLKIKRDLKCRSFEYYHNYVHPELYIPGYGIYSGEIRHAGPGDLCLDAMSLVSDLQIPLLYRCHGKGSNQLWDYTERREVRYHPMCLCRGNEMDVILKRCSKQLDTCKWSVDKTPGTSGVKIFSGALCLYADVSTKEVTLRSCSTVAAHLWIWRHNRNSRLDN